MAVSYSRHPIRMLGVDKGCALFRVTSVSMREREETRKASGSGRVIAVGDR